MVLRHYLWVFLNQTKPIIIVNQKVSTKRSKAIEKPKNKKKTIGRQNNYGNQGQNNRDIKNFFDQEEQDYYG